MPDSILAEVAQDLTHRGSGLRFASGSQLEVGSPDILSRQRRVSKKRTN